MIKAWSASRLGTYEGCPRRAMYQYIEKVQEPKSQAMLEGSRVHTLAEQYVSGVIEELPRELERFREDFADLRERPHVQVEQQLAFDENMRPTSWFGPDAWLRVVFDVFAVDAGGALVIDHKTGKSPELQHSDFSAHDPDQMTLYAWAALSLHPDLDVVDTKLWYLKYGVEYSVVYNRSDLPEIEESWRARAGVMLSDTAFEPKPGRACKWCPFSVKHRGVLARCTAG